MQPYPYSNYSNSNYRNQYTYSNQLYQQPYVGQYGNTNLGKYPQNLNINFSQSPSLIKPTSIKKPVKKVEEKEEPSSSSEDEEEEKSESDAASVSVSDNEDKQSKSESDSDEKESDKSKAESPDDEDNASDSKYDASDKSKEETDPIKASENEDNDVEKSYPELKERVKVFRNIAQELDDLEEILKKKFQYFQSENSETAISERFTRR